MVLTAQSLVANNYYFLSISNWSLINTSLVQTLLAGKKSKRWRTAMRSSFTKQTVTMKKCNICISLSPHTILVRTHSFTKKKRRRERKKVFPRFQFPPLFSYPLLRIFHFFTYMKWHWLIDVKIRDVEEEESHPHYSYGLSRIRRVVVYFSFFLWNSTHNPVQNICDTLWYKTVPLLTSTSLANSPLEQRLIFWFFDRHYIRRSATSIFFK